MGNILFLKKGLVHTAPSPWPKNFTDATWEQIITACQRRNVPASWLVGDSKPMTIDGNDYQIDIIGKNHDVYADGSGTAPLTLQLHDCVSGKSMNGIGTNGVGWDGSNMRLTLLPALFATMPDIVQASIKKVTKLTSAGNKSATIEATEDALFFLSEIEVFGLLTYSFAGEGAQYEYYVAGNTTKKPLLGTSAANWWLRSPRATNASDFCAVLKNGTPYYGGAASGNPYAPAFCF